MCRFGDKQHKHSANTTLFAIAVHTVEHAAESATADIMAPSQKLYPRGTVKKIVKAHANTNLSKNVDVLIFLDYLLFMQSLVKEAAIESKRGGERGVTARSVKKVTADTVLKFKG